MRLRFDADHLKRLLDLSRSAPRRHPVLDQVVDPAFWRADLDPGRRALLDAEVERDGIALSACSEDVDPDLIGPGLILVGDHGVYFLANIPNEAVTAAGVPHVAYAAEVNPETLPFDAWYDAKRDSFGPDDGTVLLEEALIGPHLERVPSGGQLILELTPDHISILDPSDPARGPDL